MRNLYSMFILTLSITACSPIEQLVTLPLEPEVPADDLACVGDAAARGSALRRAIEEAQDGATVSLGACVYFVADTLRDDMDHRQDTLYNAGIRIEGRDGLTIRGAGRGRTIVQFARPVLMGFEIRSNTTNLTIEDLTIAGSIDRPLCQESPMLPRCYGGRTSAEPNSHGIASTARTAGVRQVRFRRLEVRDLAVGISIGSWGGPYCDYHAVVIEESYVHDIHGTYSGSGYGIHTGCATDVVIRDNVIERAGRHSIYIGRSPRVSTDGTVVIRNTIIDHGHGEWMSPQVAAIAVARSDNVAVMDNTIVRSHTHGISVEFDPDTGLDCTRCMLIGNEFLGAGGPEDIWINARSPVWVWKNERGLGEAATVRDDSGMMSDVGGPGSFWAGTQALATDYDPVTDTDRLYVMQNGVLHAVTPDYGVDPHTGWREYRYSTARWPDFVGMAAEGGSLFVWEGGALHAVSPLWANAPWPETGSTGWSNRGEIASGKDGYLYMMTSASVHRVDQSAWTSTDWYPPVGDARGLGVGRNSLFMRLGDEVYAMELARFGTSAGLRLVD